MKIQIGDKLYDLEYHVRSMCHVEQLTGKGMDAILRMTEISGLCMLLWCGLLAGNKAMTLSDTADLVEVYLTENGFETGKTKLKLVLIEALSQANFLTAQSQEPPT